VAWWIPGFDEAAREAGAIRIVEGGSPGPTYYVLIVLSALIAAYGLLSNSTATVIGAMIVAPLMGPILGLALAIVRGDTAMFRRSLLAEASGVLVVLTVGFLVAHATGVQQIDFGASEIANRTRPTLYDVGIGFAAGLAGAFCMIHPTLQASVAGVAIAVALVPPLTVTGLTTAGWLDGRLSWAPAFGSFILFAANFLTIELAACLLFAGAGYHLRRKERTAWSLRRAIAGNLLLLLGTSIFLSHQLNSLVRERIGLGTARRVLKTDLAKIPGAQLVDLQVQLGHDQLAVTAVVGTRREITPAAVAAWQSDLQKSLRGRLPKVRANLVVRTVSSVIIGPNGYLFEPEGKTPSPEEARRRQLETVVRQSLASYEGVEMVNLRQGLSARDGLAQGSVQSLELTVESPYEFTPELVDRVQRQVNSGWASGPDQPPIALTMRTILVHRASARNVGEAPVPEPTPVDPDAILRRDLLARLQEEEGFEVLDIHLVPDAPTEDSGSVDHFTGLITLRGPRVLGAPELQRIHDEVLRSYAESPGRGLTLGLKAVTELGGSAESGAEATASPTPSASPSAGGPASPSAFPSAGAAASPSPLQR
jgi:uncharacterized hydrophobic protein (TIGR00271 family)